MALKKTARIIGKHTHRRILVQFVLFTIIALVMFGIVIFDVISQGASIWLVVIGALIGGLIGYALGWAFKINWHEDSKKVIQNADRLSFLLIGIYVVIRVVASNCSANSFTAKC
jgi:protein-S-isoprenylcysteine O-methyltransferase Ste14